MEGNQLFFIGLMLLGGLLVGVLIALFFISRKSQKVMKSLLNIMLHPERVQIADASRVLQTILADEIAKIESSFQTMRDTLNAQIASAVELKQNLTEQNDKLVSIADDATKKLAVMSGRLDNTVSGLHGVVESETWHDVETATDRFATTINELLKQVNATTQDTNNQTSQIQSQIDSWVATSETLSNKLRDAFVKNTEQMSSATAESELITNKIEELAKTTVDKFNNVRNAAADYEALTNQNNSKIEAYLEKLESFGIQSKKQLTSQLNSLINTANVVGGQVKLAETSVDAQVRKLTDAVETVMDSATKTETAVRTVSGEIAALTQHFDSEIKEFATGVVSELKTVSGVANITLENTKGAANAFSDSVKTMATGVRETLIEMNTAHTQLSGQSESLIKMSNETTAQLQPLSALIERYFAALPELSQGSVEASAKLEQIVASLTDKVNQMKAAVHESTDAVSESAIKLEDLAGTSRQQMIDLMADYAKAVDTMQTLNKQMMVARATAPMDAIKTAPSESYGRISSSDFLAQSEKLFDKLHEQSQDLTRAIGADIPDIVWKKYHAGDKTIFSKWLAKMMNAADKKQIRSMIKSDTVFRSQATQFVRSFDKIISGARETDNADKLATNLLRTDLGVIYMGLKNNL